MEEVWSWIHNERRCVTTKTVSLSMGLPRSEASALLAKLPSYKTGDYSYECTKCCMSQKDGKTGECNVMCVFYRAFQHCYSRVVIFASQS